jgi:hypothetical protein
MGAAADCFYAVKVRLPGERRWWYETHDGRGTTAWLRAMTWTDAAPAQRYADELKRLNPGLEAKVVAL